MFTNQNIAHRMLLEIYFNSLTAQTWNMIIIMDVTKIFTIVILLFLQVLAVFSEVGVNHVLYFLLFGESLLNGEWKVFKIK